MIQRPINNVCSGCLGELMSGIPSSAKIPQYEIVAMKLYVNALVCRDCDLKLKSGGEAETETRKAMVANLTKFMTENEDAKKKLGHKKPTAAYIDLKEVNRSQLRKVLKNRKRHKKR